MPTSITILGYNPSDLLNLDEKEINAAGGSVVAQCRNCNQTVKLSSTAAQDASDEDFWVPSDTAESYTLLFSVTSNANDWVRLHHGRLRHRTVYRLNF
jgi:hypothetical protein